MLNAVALNAILDVDEFLFVGMTPAKIQEALRKLKPMRVDYSHTRSQFESAVHFGALVVVVLLSYFLLLVPLQQDMLSVKREMCYGNQTFVVSHNTDTQRTIGLVTVLSRDIGNDSISEIAVRAHKATSPETTPDAFSTYISFAPDIDAFQERRSRTMREEASAYPFCVEARLLNTSGDLYGDASLLPLATQLVNTAAATVGRDGATTCQEMKAFWSLYPTVAMAYFGEGAQANMGSTVAQTVDRMLTGGCQALIEHPTDAVMDVEWCEGMPDLFRPLAHLCPESCGCNLSSGTLPSYCPSSCNFSR